MIDSAAVRRASKKLELREIVLHTASLVRGEGNIEPSLYPYSVRQRSEVKSNAERVLFLDKDDTEIPVLRAYVRLKVSGFDSDTDGDDKPLFTVNAEYRVDYVIRK